MKNIKIRCGSCERTERHVIERDEGKVGKPDVRLPKSKRDLVRNLNKRGWKAQVHGPSLCSDCLKLAENEMAQRKAAGR